MTDLTRYVRDLMRAVPEFRSLWTEELPYIVFGDFGIFLRDRISDFGPTDRLVRDSFGYVNESFNASDDLEFQNLICVGVYEPLCDRGETVSAALVLLTGEALNYFLTTLSFFGPALMP